MSSPEPSYEIFWEQNQILNLQNTFFSSMSRDIKGNDHSVNPDCTQPLICVNANKVGTLVSHQAWMKSQEQQILLNDNSYLIIKSKVVYFAFHTFECMCKSVQLQRQKTLRCTSKSRISIAKCDIRQAYIPQSGLGQKQVLFYCCCNKLQI